MAAKLMDQGIALCLLILEVLLPLPVLEWCGRQSRRGGRRRLYCCVNRARVWRLRCLRARGCAKPFAASRVAEGLYLGSMEDALDFEALARHNVRGVAVRGSNFSGLPCAAQRSAQGRKT